VLIDGSQGQIWGVCEVCGGHVPAFLELSADGARLATECSDHGSSRRVVERDPSYAASAQKVRAQDGAPTRRVQVGTLDFEVRERPSVVVVELNDDCDVTCKTCIAGSFEGAGNYKTLESIHGLILAAKNSGASTLMVSGGEPTKHPEVFRAIQLAYAEGFNHVVLISNGKRLAEEPAFAAELAAKFPTIEVYLQFDAIDPGILMDIRGHDFSVTRVAALIALAINEISTTLVCVVKVGQSMASLGGTVDLARRLPNVRGITLQPIRSSGRHEDEVTSDDSPTVGELVVDLHRQVSDLAPGAFVPHSLAPENIAVAFFDKLTGQSRTEARLREIGSDVLLAADAPANELRLLIVCYLDQGNFRSDLLAEAPIHVALAPDLVFPLDGSYLLERPTETPVVLRAG